MRAEPVRWNDVKTHRPAPEAFSPPRLVGERQFRKSRWPRVDFSNGCAVVGGRWPSIYDGIEISEASELDVDHLVPLAEAWRSGCARQGNGPARRFANDLGFANHRIAVTAGANGSKSDSPPNEWRPPRRDSWCRYPSAWVRASRPGSSPSPPGSAMPSVSARDLLKQPGPVADPSATRARQDSAIAHPGHRTQAVRQPQKGARPSHPSPRRPRRWARSSCRCSTSASSQSSSAWPRRWPTEARIARCPRPSRGPAGAERHREARAEVYLCSYSY